MANNPQGKKGKRCRRHQFTDPLVGARRNLRTQINRAKKKLRHWVKRGMSVTRECYKHLEDHIVKLESHLSGIQKSFTVDRWIKKSGEKKGKE